MKKITLRISILVLLLIAVTPIVVFACNCIDPASAMNNLLKEGIVLKAQITKLETTTKTTGSGNTLITYKINNFTLTPLAIFSKSNLPDNHVVQIETIYNDNYDLMNICSCGMPFNQLDQLEVGKQYIIFTRPGEVFEEAKYKLEAVIPLDSNVTTKDLMSLSVKNTKYEDLKKLLLNKIPESNRGDGNEIASVLTSKSNEINTPILFVSVILIILAGSIGYLTYRVKTKKEKS